MSSVVTRSSRARILSYALAVASVGALVASPATAQFSGCPGATCHVISGNVHDAGSGGPFLAGHVYIATSTLTVPGGQTLTVQAGAIVKFSGAHAFNVYGTLNVLGTSGSPAIFTSLADDVGGDHNGDGAATVPTAGQWIRLWLASSAGASQITQLHVRHAGWNGNSGIYLDGGSPTLVGCTVQSCAAACLDFAGAAQPSVVNCNFVGGTRVAVNCRLDALAGFSGCTASGQTLYGAPEATSNSIGTAAPVSVTVDDTMNGSGSVILHTTVTVSTGAQLTLGAGVVLKFSGAHAFNNYGTLTCNGTPGAPVVITSAQDDVYGGDANADGAATSPVAGQWIQLWFASTSGASSLTHVRVRHSGWNGNSTIRMESSTASLTEVTTEISAAAGLDLANNSTPTVASCHFNTGSRAAINVPIHAAAGFSGCTATGNAIYDAPEIGTASISGAVALSVDDSFNGDGVFVMTGTITVNGGQSLNLGAGVVCKFAGAHTCNVYGTLTTASPAVLTSIHDDAFGGDTNKNGGATVAAAGHWIQAWFGSASDASNLQGLRVRCAGWNGNPGVELSSADIVANDLRVQICGGPCLTLSANSFPTITNSAFENGVRAATGIHVAALSGFSACTASGNTVLDAPEVTSGSLSGSATWSVDDSFNGNGVVVAQTTLTVNGGSTLTLNAGVTVKFGAVHTLNTYGTLIANGAAGTPVTLTSLADDAVGGDTNKDAAASAAAPGQWIQAWFGGSSDASTLGYLNVRCAGWNGNPSIELSGSDATLEHVTTALAGGSCLTLGSGALPSATACAFNGGTYATTGLTLAALQGFVRCTAAGNAFYNAHRVTSASVANLETVTLSPINALNPGGANVLATTLTVNGGGTLNLAPGVIFKSEGVHSVNVYGTANFVGSGHDPVVFTHVSDDAHGGDTNVNGPSAVAAGSWTQIWFSGSGQGSLNHVLIRGAGWNGNNALEMNSSTAAVNATRADLSGGRGFFFAAAPGAIRDHLVAWNCSGEGIRLIGAQTLRHATVTGCGSNGVITASPATATAINCIAWANGTNWSGFPVGNVTYSDGLASGLGNLNVDPQFVSAATGDLRLQSTSPCVDVAEPATSFPMVFDHDEGSRLSDGKLIGAPFPDLGAYEACPYRFTVTGKPWSFETVTMQVDGPPGFAAIAFGVGGTPEFYIPWGYLTAGPLDSLFVLAIVPVGTPYTYTLPDVSAYAGATFNLQALGVPASDPSKGTFTNLYRGVLDG